jgi:hypothetical protein
MPKTAKSKSPPVPSSETEEPSDALRAAPSHEEIALRAYHIYLERERADGNPIEDWLQAERELTETSDKLQFVADTPQSRN